LVSPLAYATCANLVTYPDAPPPEGSRIVPEVAEAVPPPTDSGRTYTFRIRPGFRFSPPSNQAVTASTFKSTIERLVTPSLKSPLAPDFSGIVGYGAYVRGRARHLSGVVARGRTLTIRLAQPDGGFLAKLASGEACAVPRGTPAEPVDVIPSAGPYFVASYAPREQLVLKRNPNYHGDRPHRLDQIVFAIGVGRSRALQEVESGKADFVFDGPPAEAGPSLEAEYGRGSTAAKQGHQQYFVSEANAARILHMNTRRPLFSDVRLRRAVNYAIDRRTLVAQDRRFVTGDPFNGGTPTDDYLPPAMEGATDFHVYPLTGDLSRAKRMAGHVHATAIMYAATIPPWPQEAQVVKRDLAPLGIDVQVREFPTGEFFARIARPGEPFDLAVSGWLYGGTDPLGALNIFDGRSPAKVPHFDDPAFDRELDAAAKLSGPGRYRTFSRLALELQRDLVPAAPFATNASSNFFSARIGCQLFHPVHGIDLGALCLRGVK
jgi:ABC-type transport system substrate-binding protein